MTDPTSRLPSNLKIRTIQPSDNSQLAVIIRDTLAEFGANRPGTVYFDSSTDALSELFLAPMSVSTPPTTF